MWPGCAADPTGLALLHGARDDPSDRDRRLILADWLQDQGEEAVATCLRASLARTYEWSPFPEEVAARWRPWSGCWLGWPGVGNRTGDLPDSPWFCALYLRDCRLFDGEVEVLVEAPALAQLVYLNLAHNPIRDGGLEAIGGSPHLRRLTSLNLANAQIGPAGTQALSFSSRPPNLAAINLAFNHLGNAGALSLAEWPGLGGLTSLNLAANAVGPDGASALANSPHTDRLVSLNLYHNRIGDAGVAALARSPYLAGLTALDLKYNDITHRCAPALDALRARGVAVRV